MINIVHWRKVTGLTTLIINCRILLKSTCRTLDVGVDSGKVVIQLSWVNSISRVLLKEL